MAYEDFKGLHRRKASNKVLCDKAFSIAKNPKYDKYQRGLASMFYKFFDKKSTLLTDKSAVKSKIMLNQELAEELHKLIISKF